MKKYIKYTVIGIVALILIIGTFTKKRMAIDFVERPLFNENSKLIELVAEDDNGNKYNVDFELDPIVLSYEQVQKMFDNAYTDLWKTMMADNESVDRITTDLVFVDRMDKYGITVEWSTDNYEIIDCHGEVNNSGSDFKDTYVTVVASLTYRAYTQMYTFNFTVIPEELSEYDKVVRSIEEKLNEADSTNNTDKEVKLPDIVDNTELVFYEPSDNPLTKLLFLVIIVICYLYYTKKVVPVNKEKERNQQMLLDYSEVVLKLNLLTGAGMTCANAFGKIASDYSRALKAGKSEKRYAYEEIMTIHYQMQNGLSEKEAYMQIGKRCRLHCYIKLGTLLEQYITKGAAGLTAILKQESTDAFEERKALARRLGEEAGTKLLFPMIMMLGVVLVVIMVPAFMTF